MSAGDAGPASASSADLVRRYVIVLVVVGFWMTLGAWWRVDGNTYLLIGVPLLLIFQRFIARRPLLELWFARPGGPPPWWVWPVAAIFAAWPLYDLFTWVNPGWAVRLWLVCATLGSVPLALSLARCTRPALRELGFCFITAGVVGVFTMVLGFLVHPPVGLTAAARLFEGWRSFMLYWPVCFVLEEVFFRGGLDTYLSRDGNRAPWVSAFFISGLWGLWHLPIVPLNADHRTSQVMMLLISLPLVHIGVGVFFSYTWRRSGLLFVPVTVHAFIDAVRNALH